MHIKKGSQRIVFCFPRIGIVVKIPKISPIKGVRNTFDILLAYRRRGMKIKQCISGAWHNVITEGEDSWSWLFGGLSNNWQELIYYRKTRNIFLQPTLLSLFGIINIQRYGKPLNLGDADVWCQLVQITNEMAWLNSHEFADAENFCDADGRIRICDYGSQRTQEVINVYGSRIVEDFDFSYRWEDEKEKMVATKQVFKSDAE